MKAAITNNKGSALVVSLLMITGLAVIAGIIVVIAATEKQSTFNENAHARAFYSADAGGEAAINWIRIQNSPPGFVDASNNVYIAGGYQYLTSDHKYKFDIQFTGKRLRPGWSHEYKDFDYTIDADGESVQESRSALEIRSTRLFKEGY